MSQRYHINKKGEPGACSAQPGNCPFGSDDEHYSSIEAAKKAYEKSNATFPSSPRKDGLSEVSVLKRIATARQLHGEADDLYKKILAGGEALETTKKLVELWQNAKKVRDDKIASLERDGLGHLIPDLGPTLRVKNEAQKILLKEELLGQLKRIQGDHWKIWNEAHIIVDPTNPGRSFNAQKDNYQLNSSELLKYVGDRMVESVRDSGDTSYDNKRMRADLKDLRTIFKTSREEYSEEAAESAFRATFNGVVKPTPAATPATAPRRESTGQPQAKSTRARRQSLKESSESLEYALNSTGMTKPAGRVQGKLAGKADASDATIYGIGRKGGAYILAKADGTRARIYVPSRIPGKMIGESNIGRTVNMDKFQGTGELAPTPDLRILGFIDDEGKSYGWIPDGKINVFVQDSASLD